MERQRLVRGKEPKAARPKKGRPLRNPACGSGLGEGLFSAFFGTERGLSVWAPECHLHCEGRHILLYGFSIEFHGQSRILEGHYGRKRQGRFALGIYSRSGFGAGGCEPHFGGVRNRGGRERHDLRRGCGPSPAKKIREGEIVSVFADLDPSLRQFFQ